VQNDVFVFEMNLICVRNIEQMKFVSGEMKFFVCKMKFCACEMKFCLCELMFLCAK